jgi:putative transposase
MVYVKEEFVDMERAFLPKQHYRCSINDSIGILLRSYTRAINKQENFSGSLFRNDTKAKCINCHEGISPNFYETMYGVKINIEDSTQEYPQVCFEYIHMNPVDAGLVSKMEDWEFSSAKEYAGLSKKPLVCKERAREFINFN